MCSIQEENEMLQPLKRGESSPMARKCMKCESSAVVIIRMNDAMCSSCFTEYTTHKFRSAFGKSKVVRDQERVLVAFSGGPASCGMVHLIQGGLSKRAQKKLRFIPSLVYIDEGSVTQQSTEQRCHATAEVVSLMRDSGLSYRTYCLEQVMPPTAKEAEGASAAPSGGEDHNHIAPVVGEEDDEGLSMLMSRLQANNAAQEQLQNLAEGAKTLTAKEHLLGVLRLQLLCTVAKQQNIKKVLLGDSATRLSVHLLSSIAQGAGAHLAFKISFADRRSKEVTMIRPIREFTSKEVAVYNKLNNVKTAFIPNLSTKAAPSSSIERQTEDFVVGLQSQYPNTVSTIFRTGEKFALSQSGTECQENCCLCQCPLDTRVGTSSALTATQFSQSLCVKMAASHGSEASGVGTEDSCHGDTRNQGDSCCGQGDGACQKSNRVSITAYTDLEPWLCYGCRLAVRDMKDVNTLPSEVLHQVALQSRRAAMKNEISDFLLDD